MTEKSLFIAPQAQYLRSRSLSFPLLAKLNQATRSFVKRFNTEIQKYSSPQAKIHVFFYKLISVSLHLFFHFLLSF